MKPKESRKSAIVRVWAAFNLFFEGVCLKWSLLVLGLTVLLLEPLVVLCPPQHRGDFPGTCDVREELLLKCRRWKERHLSSSFHIFPCLPPMLTSSNSVQAFGNMFVGFFFVAWQPCAVSLRGPPFLAFSLLSDTTEGTDGGTGTLASD